MIESLNWVYLLAALAAIETGGQDDGVVGKAGEISAYQILPGLWQQHLPLEKYLYTDRQVATRVAKSILAGRVNEFCAKHNRFPTSCEVYALWHRPGLLEQRGWADMPALVKDRCQRFANLVELYESRGYAVKAH